MIRSLPAPMAAVQTYLVSLVTCGTLAALVECMDDPEVMAMEHAVNTPLTRARLQVQMMQRKGGLSELQDQQLDQVLASLDELQAACANIVRRERRNAEPDAAPNGRSTVAVLVSGESDEGVSVSANSPHIAVINDDTALLRLMDELLRLEEGYRVSTCFVGANAYAFIKQTQPDLVILDLVFGNSAEQGWRTLDLLTLDPATRRIPVIVCSAATVELHKHEEWLRRFDVEVLPKPFDLDVLLEKIADTLGVTRSSTAARRSGVHPG